MTTPTTRRQNSFDFMRFAAALAVLFSHHGSLSGIREPRLPLFDDSLGGVAVCVFFAMSGYLICLSLQRDSRLSSFAAARVLRILPNLVVALAVSSFAMMIAFDNYANWQAHVHYVWRNLQMFFYGVQYGVPGVLEGAPHPTINGSLWTLPYEVWLYALLFCLFLFRPALRVIVIPAALVMAAMFWMQASSDGTTRVFTMTFRDVLLGKLATYFLAGATIALVWPWISRRGLPVVFGSGLFIILLSQLFGPEARHAGTAIGASLALIAICESSLAVWFGRYGDASYGIYIYAYPIQQLCIVFVPGYFWSLVLATALSIAVGYATWHGFERAFLSFKPQFARLLALPFQRGADDAPSARAAIPTTASPGPTSIAAAAIAKD